MIIHSDTFFHNNCIHIVKWIKELGQGPRIKTLIITCLFQNYTSVFNKIPDNFGVRKVIDVKFSKSDLEGGTLLLVACSCHYLCVSNFNLLQTQTSK